MTTSSIAKKISLLFLSFIALFSVSSTPVDIMPPTGIPSFTPPTDYNPSAGSMQPFGMPSDEEMEQFIASMPPELQGQIRQGFQELKAMPEEERNKLFQEVEQQFNYQPTPEELAELERLSKLTPEELDAELRKALMEMGIDPDTGEPLGASAAPLATTSEPTTTATSTAAPVASADDVASIKAMLKRLAKSLENIQLKLSLHPEHSGALSGFTQELADLTYYVKVINHKSRLVTLLDEKYQNIVKALSSLEKTVSTQEPRVEFIVEESSSPSAYTILGVERGASDDEIEEAFEKLSEEKSPESVRESLKDQNLTEKELKKAVKEAQMSFAVIKDAYETLSDKKLRAQLDRELKAHDQKNVAVSSSTKQALSKIAQALSSAVYQNDIVNALEQFIKDHEPQALAEKKSLEDAEKKRKEEQKISASVRPSQTPGTYESAARLGDSSASPYGYQGSYGNYPGWPSSGYPSYPDPFAPTAQKPGSPETSGGQPGADAKETDKDKKEKDQLKSEQDSTKALKENEEDIRFLISELQKDLEGLLGAYKESSATKLIESLTSYMHNNEPLDNNITKKLERLYKNSPFEELNKKMDELAGKNFAGSDRMKQKIASTWRPIKKSAEAVNILTQQFTEALAPEAKGQKLNQQKLTAHKGSTEKPALEAITQELQKINLKLQELDQKISGTTTTKEAREDIEETSTRTPATDTSVASKEQQESLTSLNRLATALTAATTNKNVELSKTLIPFVKYMHEDTTTSNIDAQWNAKLKAVSDALKLDKIIAEEKTFIKATDGLSAEDQELLNKNPSAQSAQKRIKKAEPLINEITQILLNAIEPTNLNADKKSAHPELKNLADQAEEIRRIMNILL